jgi:hypothetical protein
MAVDFPVYLGNDYPQTCEDFKAGVGGKDFHVYAYAYSLVVDKAALISGMNGFTMCNSIGDPAGYPIWAFCYDLETDHAYDTNVNLQEGEGFFFERFLSGAPCLLQGCVSTSGKSH